jgi:hypothetical protein
MGLLTMPLAYKQTSLEFRWGRLIDTLANSYQHIQISLNQLRSLFKELKLTPMFELSV